MLPLEKMQLQLAQAVFLTTLFIFFIFYIQLHTKVEKSLALSVRAMCVYACCLHSSTLLEFFFFFFSFFYSRVPRLSPSVSCVCVFFSQAKTRFERNTRDKYAVNR